MNEAILEFGAQVRSARELLNLTTAQVAARSGLSTAEVAEVEAGSAPPDWRVVDALVEELNLRDQTARATQLVSMRSRLEAPLHGRPGTYCVCMGTELREWHWVRRGRGQIYCATHGVFLIPACYSCGYRFAELDSPAYWCPSCNIPIEAMLEHLESNFAEDFAQDESEALAAAQPTWTSQDGGADLIRHTMPVTPQDTLASHNRARELTVQGLAGRAREHYVAARTISEQLNGSAFSRRELAEVYLSLAPDKNATTVLPSDYCLHANAQAADNPWFLLREQRGRYRFVGIDGRGDRDVEVPTTEASRNAASE